ncbi:DUF4041 domain-containing protein [uncultured Methanobrevibacter sp.]|uniref:DUF4041 domain-containing protein n=1 Tax=uncultured Methanobrevibacter sp. TaxID=253161 RepID=UPI00262C7909|nr:DUF4041 domain-containing protein [uncultured Methanobrevibacter sp.]
MDKGLILVIIGGLLSCTIYGVLIGAPLTLIGAYFVYKSLKNPNQDVINELHDKQEELKNIDEKLNKMEADKEIEIKQKLADKQKELDNIQQTLDDLEAERIAEVDEKIKSRKLELENLDDTYEKLTKEKNEELNKSIAEKRKEEMNLKFEIRNLQDELVFTTDEVNLQSYGLYEPKYPFMDSTAYKEKLDQIRKQQKQMIKNKTATTDNPRMTLDGNLKKGQAMIRDTIKQILRTFNTECDMVVGKVRRSNYENSKKRIIKSYEQLNKLNNHLGVNIKNPYLNLKLEELQLALDYDLKKEEEKEALREAREREKEEKKLQKALEKERKKFERENKTIISEIEEVKSKMTKAENDEIAKLEAEIAKLQAALDKNNEEVRKINEWQETPGAGYVYIISNIGSFGEDVFKIGVTRRDNPEDRIRELSSASVPFRYDSHVFIFSKNAYELENKLHQRFDNKRVNKVNNRKEFFRISMEDVKQIVEENKGAVHSFIERPDADEYRETLLIEKNMG